MKIRFFNLLVIFIFLTGLLVVQPAVRVHAATVWTVTTTADSFDFACTPSLCSLPDAIGVAASGDTIVFGAGVTGTIVLSGGELSILNQDLTIVGPGAAQLTIDGFNNGRIFDIYGSTVSISGLKLTHGLANDILYPSGSGYPAGGAILNSHGHLTLDQMVIDHNTVSCASPCSNNGVNGTGGAIASSTNTSLTITNSSITNNSATMYGGAVAVNSGSVAGNDITLTNVTISNNQITDPAGTGGGISLGSVHTATLANLTLSNNTSPFSGGGLQAYTGAITLTNSTFSSNQAQGTGPLSGGGGIFIISPASLLLGNSTFTGNSTASEGGALYNNATTVVIYNSTFTGNSEAETGSTTGGGAITESGGTLALYNDTLSGNIASSAHGGALFNHSGSVYLQNTILANSTGSDCASENSWVSNVNNLMEVNDGLRPCDSVGFSSDPMLGPLADNGGPTRTMALLSGSPAIDNGSNSTCANVFTVNNKDQRGVTRPVDGDQSGSILCDIGAYEFFPLVDVNIGGVLMSRYDIPVHQAAQASYAGANNGPVLVTSTNSTNIIASERVAYYNGSAWTNYSELMGLPSGQLTTSYVMPWYNNVDLNTQLRFGNAGASATTVTVTVAGVVKGTYPLAPSQSARISYPGLNNGPVVVSSSGGVPIIASQRVAYFNGSAWTSFSELMGLPVGQLTTSYVMPWYNNVDLNTQLRFGNVSSSATTVTVKVAGVIQGTYPLTPSQSVRISYAGLNNGPVQITSSAGVPIIVSQRVAYTPDSGTTWTSFAELMGLPVGQLTTSYAMPLYDNVNVNSQLRFGNVGNSSTNVTVTVGGVVQGTYPLAPSQSVRVSYAGLNNGPVQVQSSGGVPIIVSQRVAYYDGTAWTSFSELMGLPFSQLTTSYVMPWYNNVDLNTQLRIGVP